MIDSALQLVQYAFAFLLVLGPLIVVHEFGHFAAAKYFGIGVPVFSVGLGPRLFGFRRRETDYRFSAIPLGGFVRLQGDEADEGRTGAPEEFLSRPRYQRVLVYLAGPAVNLVLALFLVWLVLVAYGIDEVPTLDAPPVVVSVAEGSSAAASGVRLGDRLLSIGGRDARDAETVMREIALNPDVIREIVVERDGERLTLQLETGSDPKYHLGDPGWVVTQPTTGPALITQVLEGPAQEAGLEAGDVVVGAGGREPIDLVALRLLLASSPGVAVPLTVERDGRRVELTLVPRERDGQGYIGVGLMPSEVVHLEFGPLEALAAAVRINLRQSTTLFVTLEQVIRGRVPVRAFSGPIEIAQVSRRMVSGGLRTVLSFMAFISLQLGILNLLPIPVLDGGHILILGIESGMRRALPDRLKERVLLLGMVFLLAFFVVIIYFDIVKTAASS